jgi:hypothetical protein
MAWDIGSRNDYMAGVVVRQTPEFLNRFPGDRELIQFFDVVHLERFRGMSYLDAAEHVRSLMLRPELKGMTTLVVDATQVGLPVTQLMQGMGLSPVGITITGGSRASMDSFMEGSFLVPKRDLYMSATVIMQNGRLRIAELPLKKELDDELKGFQYKVTRTGRETAGNETDSLHDDLAMALCMAIWMGTKGGIKTVQAIDDEFTDNLGGSSAQYPEWNLMGGEKR